MIICARHPMHSPISVHYLCSLAIYLLLHSINESVALPAPDQVRAKWTELSGQLLGTNQPDLEPAKVFRLLKQTDKIFEELDKPLSSEDAKKAIKVKTLLEFSKVDKTDCSLESFKSVNKIAKTFSFVHEHLRRYIGHFINKKFEACEQNLVEYLKTIIENRLSDDQRKDMNLLAAKVMSSNPQVHRDSLYLSVPEESLLEGLILFLDLKRGPLKRSGSIFSNKIIHFDDYEKKFEPTIFGLCRAIDFKLKDWLTVYDQLLINDEDIADKMDKYSFNWLINARICHEVMERDYSLAEQTYELLSGENISPKEWRKLLDSLRCASC